MLSADKLFEIKLDNQTDIYCINNTTQYLVFISHNPDMNGMHYVLPALANKAGLVSELESVVSALETIYKNKALSSIQNANRDLLTSLSNNLQKWKRNNTSTDSLSGCYTHSGFCVFPKSCIFSTPDTPALKLINQTFNYFKEIYITAFPGGGPDFDKKPNGTTVIDLSVVSSCHKYSECLFTTQDAFLESFASQTLRKVENMWNEKKNSTELLKYHNGTSCRAPTILCYTSGKCVVFCLNEFINALKNTGKQLLSLWEMEPVFLDEIKNYYEYSQSVLISEIESKNQTKPMYIYCDLGLKCYSAQDIEYSSISDHLSFMISASVTRIAEKISKSLNHTPANNKNGKQFELCNAANETTCPVVSVMSKLPRTNSSSSFVVSTNLTKGPYPYEINALRVTNLNRIEVTPEFCANISEIQPTLVPRIADQHANPNRDSPKKNAQFSSNQPQLQSASILTSLPILFSCLTLLVFSVYKFLVSQKNTPDMASQANSDANNLFKMDSARSNRE